MKLFLLSIWLKSLICCAEGIFSIRMLLKYLENISKRWRKKAFEIDPESFCDEILPKTIQTSNGRPCNR